MNKKQHKKLEQIIDQLQIIHDEEEEKYDNAPENLLYSDRYEKIQDIMDNLDETIEILQSIIEE